MEAQSEEIRKHKWIRSKEAGRDLGKEAEDDWISKYAKLYREYFYRVHEIKVEYKITSRFFARGIKSCKLYGWKLSYKDGNINHTEEIYPCFEIEDDAIKSLENYCDKKAYTLI